MNRISIIILLLSIVAIFNNCRDTKSPAESDNLVSIDSLQLYSQYDEMMTTTNLVNDTLKFLTTDSIAYFPLGVFENIEDLTKKYNFFKVEKELQYPYKDSTMQIITIYNLIFSNSKIKVFPSQVNIKVNIIYGEIVDSKIVLTNGIEVGQSKSTVLKKFYSKLPENYEKINVIELESGLEGIWHYYDFKNDQLTSIKFDTDYRISNK
jgi:hypothetical protein